MTKALIIDDGNGKTPIAAGGTGASTAADARTNLGLGTIATKNYAALDVAVNEAQGSDIASATTTDIGAATGNYVNVTGTTTITGLGTVQAGTRRIVNFTGALTLTHNATSLILPTAANITTAAGDTAVFVSLGSGNWKCVSYDRASGEALASSGGGVSDGDKGDITVSGSGATWTIDSGAVSLAKQADVATSTVFYRKTAGTGAPEVQTLATLKTDLGLTGTNSGDQDLSGYQLLTEKNEDNGYAGLQTGHPNNELRLYTNAGVAQYQVDGIHRRSVAPTVNDDATSSYLVDDLWSCDSGADKGLYICTDNTDGAAVWVKLANVGGGGGGSPAGSPKQLQFNSSGSFGATRLEYVSTSTNEEFTVPAQTVADTKGYNYFLLGSFGKGTGDGGDIVFTGGYDELASVASGALVTIHGANTASAKGGDLELQAGLGTSQGGNVSVSSLSNAPTGGYVIIASDTVASGGGVRISTNPSANYAQFDGDALTANRTLTIPDASGTIALTSDITGGLSRGAANMIRLGAAF